MRRAGTGLTIGLAFAAMAATARADDPVDTVYEDDGTDDEDEPGPLVLKPSLTFDPVLRPQLQGEGGERDGKKTSLLLGPRTRATVEGVWWQINQDQLLPNWDVEARGWNAGLRIDHDLGWAQFQGSASVNRVDTRYGTGTYVDVGLSLRRTKRLSRWMTGWISLGVGIRQWQGTQPPPAGEKNAIGAMLTLGTTF